MVDKPQKFEIGDYFIYNQDGFYVYAKITKVLGHGNSVGFTYDAIEKNDKWGTGEYAFWVGSSIWEYSQIIKSELKNSEIGSILW